MRQVEIAGGGIAGFVAAISFARNGWKVRVHEKSDRLRTAGNGFVVWANGLRVLGALNITPDIDKVGNQIKTWDVRNEAHGLLKHYDMPSANGGRAAIFTRQELVDLLSATAVDLGVEISLGSNVAGVTADGQMSFADGRTISADLIVCADGVFSNARRSLLGDLPIAKHRKGAIRMLLPSHPDQFSERDRHHATEFNHPEGRRAGIIPCAGGLVYVILVSMMTDPAAHTVPIDVDYWSKTFPSLTTYFEQAGSLGHFDQYFSVSAPSWHLGRCAVIGDAAHGMTPAIGQGACSAMMSAYTLGHTDFGTGKVEDGLARWEAMIRPLLDMAQEYSRATTAGLTDPNSHNLFLSDPAIRPMYEADIPALYGQTTSPEKETC